MKQRKVPMRMCVVTHERCEKKDLVRIVKTSDGVIVDLTGKVNGHGVYLQKNIDVINKAFNNKILEKSLECEIDTKIYDELMNLVSSNG